MFVITFIVKLSLSYLAQGNSAKYLVNQQLMHLCQALVNSLMINDLKLKSIAIDSIGKIN